MIPRTQFEQARPLFPDGSRHLHGRPFAAKRQSGAERQYAANELDWQYGGIQRVRAATYDRFDTLHAAARRLGRVASDKPAGQVGSASGNQHWR